ncbi:MULTISPECIES: ABC transporter substrate-binding protein [unclassified Adlercreutzia]|uniref:ABC transporter substrate-binding protein n=1 Tax=unclassified Adlercreutzia TaxID=2636013 RepID=UPI0013ECAE00|nr:MULTISPECIES: ABC transporter substrate-binding protein [unclassified Adlercreutzia]
MEQVNLTRRGFLAGTAATGALAALTLSGCGGGGEEKKPAESSAAEAQGGGTITAACSYKNSNYNPVGASSALMLPAIQHCLEGLYELDYFTGKVNAALAAGEPTEVSKTEYEVKLREGAKYSDGNAVTAADVVACVEANKANATYADMLSFIESAEAKDDATVTFKLGYEFIDSANLLKERLSLVRVFPASEITTEPMKTPATGSGAWMWGKCDGEDGGALNFTPNPNYNGAAPAKADAMEWLVRVDNTARVTALQEGTAVAGENIPFDNVDQLVNAGVTVESVPSYGIGFLMFNTQKAPFNDKRVRQAFFYAIDYDKIISNQLGGTADKITSYLPESNPAYHKASTVYTYDPEKAKALLKEAGQESMKVTLLVIDNWIKSISNQIQQDLLAVGIDCTLDVQAAPYPTMAPSPTNEVLPFDVFLAPGDVSCFGTNADVHLSWFYGQNTDWAQGRSCWAKCGDGKCEEFNGYLMDARKATDEAARQDAWNKCFDLISEEVPLYPLFHKQVTTGWWDEKIDGFEPSPTTGLYFQNASLK